jgi:hypothetical protein
MQVEYLWLPLSFVEPDGMATVEAVHDCAAGVVTVVPVILHPTYSQVHRSRHGTLMLSAFSICEQVTMKHVTLMLPLL